MEQTGLPQYLAVVMEEYKTIREESKQASINMYTALQWGAAVQGIVIAGGFSQWGKENVVVLIAFFVLVPALSSMTLLLWLGEAARLKRAGDYVMLLEQKLGLLLADFEGSKEFVDKWKKLQPRLEENLRLTHSGVHMSDPLTWEQWLRDRSGQGGSEGHLKRMYQLRAAIFPFLMLTSLLIAAYYSFIDPAPVSFKLVRISPDFRTSEQWLVPLLFFIGSVGSVVTTWYAVVVGRALSRPATYEPRATILSSRSRVPEV